MRLRHTAAKPPEMARLFERRLATAVPVREPLVLVSQVQRSGGTLLSQLFDAHPQLHAHPYELKIGKPKDTWPRLDLAATAEAWWKSLYEFDVRRLFDEGYAKYSAGGDGETFPFLLPLQLQRRLFARLVEEAPPRTLREVLDRYFTSYFNAWLDNQNLYATPKRAITAFTPRLIADPAQVEAFFATYPDGHLVSLVREPASWLASASRHDPEAYADVDAALAVWRASTQSALDARDARADRVLVCTYERLVTSTEDVMRELAGRIGIDFAPTLLRPTFNGMPIRADSAFEVADHGITTSPLGRAATLDPGVRAHVETQVGDLYASAASAV
jgi:hypothetical protein